jgi:hypothetical protein
VSWVIKSDNEISNDPEGSSLPISRVSQGLGNKDNGFEQRRETAIDRSIRGGISIALAVSIHLSQTSGDSASEQSSITTGSSTGKCRKKRYAKHVGKAEQSNKTKTAQAPLSDSPSIFNLPASFEGKQDCDAPLICPQIPSHYSPPDVRFL